MNCHTPIVILQLGAPEFQKALEKNKKIWYNTVWLQKMRQIAKRHVKFNRKTRIPDIKSFLFELQKIGGEEEDNEGFRLFVWLNRKGGLFI